jgi:Reverse transcriptase (RNA-dependent DNA polymerase)
VPPKIIKTNRYLLSHRQSQVLTAYGPSKKFRPVKGVPQGGVESHLIWQICYDICLARLRKENSVFSSSIYLMRHSPTLPALMSSSIPKIITVTSFMDDLILFFGDRDQLTLGL